MRLLRELLIVDIKVLCLLLAKVTTMFQIEAILRTVVCSCSKSRRSSARLESSSGYLKLWMEVCIQQTPTTEEVHGFRAILGNINKYYQSIQCWIILSCINLDTINGFVYFGVGKVKPSQGFFTLECCSMNFLGVIILFVHFSPLLFIFDCTILVISC